jgi:hypothetical protein
MMVVVDKSFVVVVVAADNYDDVDVDDEAIFVAEEDSILMLDFDYIENVVVVAVVAVAS